MSGDSDICDREARPDIALMLTSGALAFPELADTYKAEPEVLANILSAYGTGSTSFKWAARKAGIDESTLKEWRVACPALEALFDSVKGTRMVEYQGQADVLSRSENPVVAAGMTKFLMSKIDPAYGESINLKIGPDSAGEWAALEKFLGNPNAKGLALLESMGWVRRETIDTEGIER